MGWIVVVVVLLLFACCAAAPLLAGLRRSNVPSSGSEGALEKMQSSKQQRKR